MKFDYFEVKKFHKTCWDGADPFEIDLKDQQCAHFVAKVNNYSVIV